MQYTEWKPFYDKIKKDLQLNFEKDKDAAEFLNSLLDGKYILPIKEIKKIIENKEVFIFGAGASLEETIRKHKEKIEKGIKIVADGATSALLKNSIRPDIIVTDLDGFIDDQLKANLEGSILIIHAHGNNLKSLKKHLKNFKGKILGTTQTNPSYFKNLYNFGGFTDGDRAIFLADHFNAKKIFLAGFDFNGKIGKYSFSENKDLNIKLKKLTWCKKLIQEITKKNKDIEFL